VRSTLTLFFSFLLLFRIEATTHWSADAIAPCAIHNGSVNVITGQYVEYVPQIELHSPFQIDLPRGHIGADRCDEGQPVICWTMGTSYLTACYKEGEIEWIAVDDLSGSRVGYGGRNFSRPILGDLWSNVAWGEVSGRTNPKNRELSTSGRFCLSHGNGEVHHFDSSSKRQQGICHFPLRTIERASGQKIEVTYGEGGISQRPIEMALHSCSREKLTWLRFDYQQWGSYSIKASDGQQVDYMVDLLTRRLRKVSQPGCPDIRYEYETSTHSRYTEKRHLHLLTKRSEGENFLRNSYYAVGKNWVGSDCIELKSAKAIGRKRVEHPAINCIKEQFAPVGEDGKEECIARYYYHFQPLRHYEPEISGSTHAIDSYGNRTIYSWLEGQRISSIKRYQGQDQLLMGECYFYQGGELTSKILLDEGWRAAAAVTLKYDGRGNVTEERLWGDLTGDSSAQIELDETGIPKLNGVGCHIIKRQFGENNLPIEEVTGDRRICASYLNRIDLRYKKASDQIATLALYNKQELVKRLSFQYDQNGVLVELTEENGTRRRTIRIRLVTSGPAIGLPERIEEYAGDLFTGAVERRYGRYNLVTCETRFDANNVPRFSIYSDYDEAGRLVGRSDPLGHLTILEYDSCGRLVCERGPRAGYEIMQLFVCKFANIL
jgi:YD repeat-containing protein